MQPFVDSLLRALDKKKETVRYSIQFEKMLNEQMIFSQYGLIFPMSVSDFYLNVKWLKISDPSKFEILSFANLILIDNRYLNFSIIDFDQRICFDTSHFNEAEEWDIVNYESRYIITKTLASYLTNKIWAWLERGRKIWQEEKYD